MNHSAVAVGFFLLASAVRFYYEYGLLKAKQSSFFGRLLFNSVVCVWGFSVFRILGSSLGMFGEVFLMIAWLSLLDILARVLYNKRHAGDPPDQPADSQDPPADGGNGT